MNYVRGNGCGVSLCERFIKKLVYAKNVKVKLVGYDKSDTITLSSKDILALKEMYEYYIATCGKFTDIYKVFTNSNGEQVILWPENVK